MKNLRYIAMSCLALLAVGFTACNDDDEYFGKDAQNSAITIEKIFLHDVESSVPSREVTFARLQQTIRIQGKGLYGARKVYINGYDSYFNRALVSDNSLIVQINKDTPVMNASEEVRNTIRITKDGSEATYEFEVRAASPSIDRISCTLPAPGELITVYGSNLHETSQVTLPGNVIVTEGIQNDPDGEWFSFTMPSGVTESGSIYSKGGNGDAASPAYFNDNRCYIVNFDDLGKLGSWSATYTEDDLVEDPLNCGHGKVAMLIPPSQGELGAGANSLMWATAGNDEPTDVWDRMYEFIPATTDANDLAIQFDAYVPEPWGGSGQMEISLQNNLSGFGYGSSETTFTTNIAYPTAVLWIPWLVDGKNVPYTTGERWTTVTIPLTKIGKYSDEGGSHTFQEVVDDRKGGSYCNFCILFVNKDLVYSEEVTFDAVPTSQRVYIDNVRIVPNAKIKISDYPEDEEEGE